jgi:hypothetical protein
MEMYSNDFGGALAALRDNKKVQRAGWNGKGMFLVMFSPVAHGMDDAFEIGGHGVLPLLPFIVMKTADDKWVPWLASQTDLLAEDWCIVDNVVIPMKCVEIIHQHPEQPPTEYKQGEAYESR